MINKDLHWKNEKPPLSQRFGDVYFSSDDGLMESRHVFLKAIHAPEIWQKKGQFTLLENGFGTGLNFIMTCQEWLKTTPPQSTMTYIATEKYPLTKDDIERALSCWPELSAEKAALLEIYPPLKEGFHRYRLWGGRIKLILLIGDSAKTLQQLEASVDAFYLDGFAPGCNPDMWTENIYRELSRLAAPKARLATFSAAGAVRRGLTAVGFQMQKTDGFGKKRESLHGEYSGPAAPTLKPWYRRPSPIVKGSNIAIIGGGIAGLTSAMILQNDGYRVTVYERECRPMNQASGNPAGILDPTLNMGNGPDAVFYRAALTHALDFFHRLDPKIFLTRGLIKYSGDKQLDFPQCGAISPPRIREILAAKLTINNDVDIKHLAECDHADAIIICGGPTSRQFPETNQLALDPVRGQITLLDATDYADPPTQVLCGKGYLIPPVDNIMVTGASFCRGDTDTDIREIDHQENLKNAELLWPGISSREVIGGRCAIRAYSPDHLPLCGPVPNYQKYHTAFEMLKHGPRHKNFPPAPYHPNLYMVSGLGARGFMAAPLLGDILSALISGEPLPVPRSVYESLHPARFLIRELIKGK